MKFIFALSLLAFTMGCAHAKIIKETKDGGRIVIYGSREMGGDGAREKAKVMMAQKCTKGYEVTETGQQIIGMMAGYSVSEPYYEFKCN